MTRLIARLKPTLVLTEADTIEAHLERQISAELAWRKQMRAKGFAAPYRRRAR